jgi:heme/copper-type cytochrome/quinol oxidase subunit 2
MPVSIPTINLFKNRRTQIALLLGIAMVALALVPLPASVSAPQARFFRVKASDFDYSPAVLRVNPGDRVTIELAAQDVVHGIYIDGYDLEVHADPGQPARLSFVANKTGSFRLRCSVTCGALHPFMTGQLKVGVNWLFWKALGEAMLAVLAGFWMAVK